MVFSPYIIRIVARTIIDRYAKGDGTLDEIIDSYGEVQPDDRAAILEEIYRMRPDLQP